MTSLTINYSSEAKKNVANLTEIFTNIRKKRWHGRKMRVKE
jgi:DNA topoisomerase VI subunit B